MPFTPDQLATELAKPRYATELAAFLDLAAKHAARVAAWEAYLTTLQSDEPIDESKIAGRYLPTDPLQALLNEAGAATRAARPITTQQLLLAVGAAGIAELAAAGLLGLLPIAGPTFDLGDPAVVAMVGAMLTGGNPLAPSCPHCLAVLATLDAPQPCTPVEALGAWGDTADHNAVLAALGVTP